MPLTAPSAEIRVSQYRILPRAIFSGVRGFSGDGIYEGRIPGTLFALVISCASVVCPVRAGGRPLQGRRRW